MKPYCFVLMPFGTKKDGNGKKVEFDLVYERIIKPAIEDAGLNPIRADEEKFGGIIHKPMFERLMLCKFAVADLTTANANVFYELGIRHGIRPHSTVLIFAEGMRLPFDVAPLRALPYKLDKKGSPTGTETTRRALAGRLRESKNPSDDSPLFQLVSDMPRPDLDRLKTDTFRDTVEYSETMKKRLRAARGEGSDALAAIESELGDLVDVDPAIIIDLFLSYRSVENWQAMEDLAGKMPPLLAQSVLVQEQLALALNRLERHGDAERVLSDLIAEYGASSETNGILGRVYKDLWKKHAAAGKMAAAAGYLKKAIECYLTGFEADSRDAYPGINAATLMVVSDPVDSRLESLLPVIRFSVERRLASENPDYWDFATRLELDVIEKKETEATQSLSRALPEIREKWEPKSTAQNLKFIRAAHASRGEETGWIERLEDELIQAAESM